MMSVMADPLDTCPVTKLERGERGTGGSVEDASSHGLLDVQKSRWCNFPRAGVSPNLPCVLDRLVWTIFQEV